MLKGKKILLGVTGSIAAYKAAFLVRLLVKKGAQVRVVMTPDAKEFITPLTLSTLSKNPVPSTFTSGDEGLWNNHVEMGLWADLFLIAPASANTISKMANGLCDNLLLAVYLSAKCPVFVAPAMDLDMYDHKATQNNFKTITRNGDFIIPVGKGELASGLYGDGRMAEPEEIIYHLEKYLFDKLPLRGLNALVTAGPTIEPIDPVRFIGNHSSGKMGFAIAEELASQGANVILVSGPVNLETRRPNIKRVDVTTAAEMFSACMKHFPKMQLIVKAAAVADYRPGKTFKDKIKKESGAVPELILERTVDILSEMGKKKRKGQVIIGFALETKDEDRNAKAKLKRKNLDAIVLNSTREKGAGFGTSTNKVKIFTRNNKTLTFELKEKTAVAKDIVTVAKQLLKK